MKFLGSSWRLNSSPISIEVSSEHSSLESGLRTFRFRKSHLRSEHSWFFIRAGSRAVHKRRDCRFGYSAKDTQPLFEVRLGCVLPAEFVEVKRHLGTFARSTGSRSYSFSRMLSGHSEKIYFHLFSIRKARFLPGCLSELFAFFFAAIVTDINILRKYRFSEISRRVVSFGLRPRTFLRSK